MRRLLLDLRLALGAAALGGLLGWIAYPFTLQMTATLVPQCPGPPPTDFSRPIPSCATSIAFVRANGDLATEALYILGGALVALLIVMAIWLWYARIRPTRSRRHVGPGLG